MSDSKNFLLSKSMMNNIETASLLYEKTKEKLGYGEKLKDIVENGEQQQDEDNVDLTPQEHKKALKGAYRSFRTPGLPRADLYTYIERITPHIKALIKQQVVMELGSAKVLLHMCKKEQKWDNPFEDIEDIEDTTPQQWSTVHEIIVEKVFNNKITEIFQGSDIEEILRQMFASIKTQTENHAFPESYFTLDSMHLDIDFHRLKL